MGRFSNSPPRLTMETIETPRSNSPRPYSPPFPNFSHFTLLSSALFQCAHFDLPFHSSSQLLPFSASLSLQFPPMWELAIHPPLLVVRPELQLFVCGSFRSSVEAIITFRILVTSFSLSIPSLSAFSFLFFHFPGSNSP